MLLNKKDILKVKLKTERLTVPELGGEVIISEMGGADRDAFTVAFGNRDKSKSGTTALYAAYTLVDNNGDRMFDVGDIDDLAQTVPGKALDRIFDVAEKLNRVFSNIEDDVKKS